MNGANNTLVFKPRSIVAKKWGKLMEIDRVFLENPGKIFKWNFSGAHLVENICTEDQLEAATFSYSQKNLYM